MAVQRTLDMGQVRDALNARRDGDHPPDYTVDSIDTADDTVPGQDSRRPLTAILANDKERWQFQFGDWRQELPSLSDGNPAALTAFVELVSSYLDELWEFKERGSIGQDVNTRLG